MSLWKSRRAQVTTPDLEYPVESLAGGIQSAMRSLYNVQMSLIDCLSYSRSPAYILDDFKYIRGLFRAEWENDNNSLQNCYNYCDEWIALGDFTASMPPANQGFTATRDTLMLGTDVYNEARDMRSRHERLHKELRKHRHGFTSVLSSENSRARRGRWSRMAPGLSNAHFFQETHLPSGMDSLTEAYASLSNISMAMGDIVVFLKDHLDQMSSSCLVTFPMTIYHLQGSAERWSNSKPVLLAAMSSISKSLHTVTVDPASVPPPPPVTYPPLLDSTIPRHTQRLPYHVTAVPRDAHLYPEESISLHSRGKPVWSRPGFIVAVLTLLLTFIGVVGTMTALQFTKRPDS